MRLASTQDAAGSSDQPSETAVNAASAPSSSTDDAPWERIRAGLASTAKASARPQTKVRIISTVVVWWRPRPPLAPKAMPASAAPPAKPRSAPVPGRGSATRSLAAQEGSARAACADKVADPRRRPQESADEQRDDPGQQRRG